MLSEHRIKIALHLLRRAKTPITITELAKPHLVGQRGIRSVGLGRHRMLPLVEQNRWRFRTVARPLTETHLHCNVIASGAASEARLLRSTPKAERHDPRLMHVLAASSRSSDGLGVTFRRHVDPSPRRIAGQELRRDR